jgi:hypothetical protein
MTSKDNSEECAIHRLEVRTGEVMKYVFVFSIFYTRTTYCTCSVLRDENFGNSSTCFLKKDLR